MNGLQYADDDNFEDVLKNSKVPILVDFFAEWCPPCRKLGPTLEALAEDMEGRLTIVKVNVDESNLASQYGVMNIPTMVLFKDGEEVKRMVGNQAKKKLIKELEPHL